MVLSELVELGVATFRGLSEAEDDLIVARLEALGLPAWLATRLVTFLPIAFGAQLLTGKLPEPSEVSVNGQPRRLGDDAVYLACRERARVMSRDEAQLIATRSAVVKVVDQVLSQTGKWPTDGDFVLSVGELPEPDGSLLPGAAEAFRAFLEGHGLGSAASRCGARVFPVVTADRFRVQVDFTFADERLPKGFLIESFAGLGATWPDAISDAIRKFERGAFHPIVAALVDRRAGGDQVTWETWADAEGPRAVCLGSLLLLYNPVRVELAPVLDGLRSCLRAMPRDEKVHTFRVFTARDGATVLGNEVLLDGETWPEGLAVLERHALPNVSPVWGARLFGVVLPPSTT